MTAADSIGARAMLVHAIDEDAVAFYRKFGFEPSPLDPKQLMLLMKDLGATLSQLVWAKIVPSRNQIPT
jgi:hypothetical protein